MWGSRREEGWEEPISEIAVLISLLRRRWRLSGWRVALCGQCEEMDYRLRWIVRVLMTL